MNTERYNMRDYFELPNNGLIMYFNRVHDGQSDDFRTPFWNERPREQVLGEWFEILDHDSSTRNVPGLMTFEEDMMSKVGPLSVMKPLSERMEDIQSYYDCIKLKSVPIYSKAISAFLSKVKRIKVRPWDALTTIENMRLSTNSGAPFFHKRRSVVDKTMKVLSEEYPAVLGWRGQEGGPDVEDVKQRVVWMFPFSVNIRELMAYSPLIKAWQAESINSAYISSRAVEEKITACFDSKGDDYVVVTDFTKFDQHFNPHLQDVARIACASMLTGQTGSRWLQDVFDIKYNIPLAISPFEMFTGRHGMGSGSGGTNFDECCAHSCLQEEVALIKGAKLNPYSNAYGDDGYLTYPGIDVDDVIDCYTSHGQEMNPAKQSVSKNSAVYLRRYYHTGYRDRKGIMLGIYSSARAIGRLMGQERYWSHDEVGYAEYLTLRAWSILENCNQHPAFDKLVDFVIKGDQYQLGLKIPGFIEGFEQTFDKLRELDPDVLGYTKTLQSGQKSVRDWRIYQRLRALA